MRGKLFREATKGALKGLIPAHAGKTSECTLMGRFPQAHPRACGENCEKRQRGDEKSGSSPRMRGKLVLRPTACLMGRLIPAHAGKTEGGGVVSRRGPAHPRACGENFEHVGETVPFVGSSPRMRGKHIPLLSRPGSSRLIPAHAGKTRSDHRLSCHRQAHPRACGENPTTTQKHQPREGSSPRMRGKQSGDFVYAHPLRLIPAHAGKTFQGCYKVA